MEKKKQRARLGLSEEEVLRVSGRGIINRVDDSFHPPGKTKEVA